MFQGAIYSSNQIIGWLTARNAFLGGRSPIEMIDDSDAVLRAALQESRFVV